MTSLMNTFRIVRSPGHSLQDLENAVNKAISEGWIMHGTHVWVERSQEWTQAMIPAVPMGAGNDLRLREGKRKTG